MNFTLIYMYSKIYKNQYKTIVLKILKNLFFLGNLLIYALNINNDYSLYTSVILNFFSTTGFYENLI
jgi:hypothetical protein